MKKLLLIPIIVGGAVLITGSIIFGLAFANQSKTELADQTFDINETITNFDFNLSTADLLFKESDSAKVVCRDSEKEYHEVTIKDGTLKINYVDTREWYEKIFNWSTEQRKVTVYVPAGEYGDLNIKSSTGNITVPHDFSFTNFKADVDTGNYAIKSNVTNTIDLESSTGAVFLDDLSAKEIKIKCSTGRVGLTKVNVLEKITISSSTGKQKVTDTKCQNIEIKASTGDIVFTNTIVEKHIQVKTSTGMVTFYDSDAESLNIKTDTGDVTGNLLTNKFFEAKSDTGKIDVPEYHLGDEVTGKCVVETDTGDIKLRVGA